jgi:prepilin-type N-terminal cleavage/methylation domain-containing protein
MKTQTYPSMPSKRAFTLVEVLIVVMIMPLLLAVIFVVMDSGNKIYSAVTVSMDIRQSARNAMERILREVRESNNSAVTVLSTNADRITFTTPRFKDAGGVQIPISYYLNAASGQIIREYPPNTLKPVAVDVTKLKFVKSGPQLDITINTSQLDHKRLLSYYIKQKVRLRNE